MESSASSCQLSSPCLSSFPSRMAVVHYVDSDLYTDLVHQVAGVATCGLALEHDAIRFSTKDPVRVTCPCCLIALNDREIVRIADSLGREPHQSVSV